MSTVTNTRNIYCTKRRRAKVSTSNRNKPSRMNSLKRVLPFGALGHCRPSSRCFWQGSQEFLWLKNGHSIQGGHVVHHGRFPFFHRGHLKFGEFLQQLFVAKGNVWQVGQFFHEFFIGDDDLLEGSREHFIHLCCVVHKVLNIVHELFGLFRIRLNRCATILQGFHSRGASLHHGQTLDLIQGGFNGIDLNHECINHTIHSRLFIFVSFLLSHPP